MRLAAIYLLAVLLFGAIGLVPAVIGLLWSLPYGGTLLFIHRIGFLGLIAVILIGVGLLVLD